jgi:hypothetical protein
MEHADTDLKARRTRLSDPSRRLINAGSKSGTRKLLKFCRRAISNETNWSVNLQVGQSQEQRAPGNHSHGEIELCYVSRGFRSEPPRGSNLLRGHFDRLLRGGFRWVRLLTFGFGPMRSTQTRSARWTRNRSAKLLIKRFEVLKLINEVVRSFTAIEKAESSRLQYALVHSLFIRIAVHRRVFCPG